MSAFPPLLEHERTWCRHRESDVIDPKPTSGSAAEGWLLSLELLYSCILDDTRPKGLLTFDYFGEFRRGVREGHVSEIDHTLTHLRRVHDLHCFAIESFDDKWWSLGRHEQTKPD